MFERIVGRTFVFIFGMGIIMLGLVFLTGLTKVHHPIDIFFASAFGIAFIARGAYIARQSIT